MLKYLRTTGQVTCISCSDTITCLGVLHPRERYQSIELYFNDKLKITFHSSNEMIPFAKLRAHSRQIDMLVCSLKSSTLLYLMSYSYDKIVIWNLDSVMDMYTDVDDVSFAAKVVERGDIGDVSCASFDSTGSMLALGLKREISIVFSESM